MGMRRMLAATVVFVTGLSILAGTAARAVSAPTITSVTPGNTTLSVAYSSVAGAVSYGYTLDGAQSGVCGASPCVITGLTNGTEYSVVIGATDAVTWSYSEAVAARPGTPSAPTITSTSTTATQLVIDYTPPAVANGTISDYEFYVNGTRIQNAQYWASAPFPSPLRAPVAGLSPPYTIRMAAVNGTGLGVFTSYTEGASSQAPAPTPSVPGAPGVDVLEVGTDFVRVKVSAPAAENGAPVTAVRVSVGDDSRTGNPGSEFRFSPLAEGSPVTLTAQALNVAGWGASTSVQASTLEVTVPGAPGIEVLERGTTYVTYRLTAPASDGGRPISEYASNIAGQRLVGGDPAQVRQVAGLVPGRAYEITAQARNEKGWGALSRTTVTTTGGAPSTPSWIMAVPSKDGATIDVTWGPSQDNGVPIRAYRVTMGGNTWCSAGASTRNCSFTGAAPGTTVSVGVSARNDAGSSATRSVDVVMPVGPPGVLPWFSVWVDPRPWTASGRTYPKPVNIDWELPTYTGGSPIDAIEFKMPGISFPWGKWECRSEDFAKKHCQVYVDGDYPQDSPLSMRVRNKAGFWSQWRTTRMKESKRVSSYPPEPQPPTGVPAAPAGLAASAQGSRTVVTWAYPSEVTGVAPDAYGVRTTCVGACTGVRALEFTCGPFDPHGSCSLTGLLGGVRYEIAVAAYNASGASTTTKTQVTAGGSPKIPGTPTVTWSGPSVKVAWQAVPGGGIEYLVRSDSTVVCRTTTTACLVTPASPAVMYTVSSSREGYLSEPSVPSEPIGIAPVPTPVEVRVEQLSLTRALITWAPPAFPSTGQPLTARVTAVGSPESCQVAASAGRCELILPEGFEGDASLGFTSLSTPPGESVSVSLTMVPAPNQPINVGARTNLEGDVVVTWGWTGGIYVPDGWLIRAYADGRQESSCERPVYQLTCTFRGLAAGREYAFTVEAVGQFGSSRPTDAVMATAGPLLGAKAVSATQVGSSGLAVSWQLPLMTGGRRLLNNAYVEVNGPVNRSCSRNDGNPADTCLFSDLPPGEYTATVTLEYATSQSITSAPAGPVRVGAPHQPDIVSVEQDGSAVRVVWRPSRSGPRPTGYEVTVSGGLSCPHSGTVTSCTIRGASAGQALRITVSAQMSGMGSSPAATAAFTPVGLPAAVTGVSAVPTPGGVRITWTSPAGTSANLGARYDVLVLKSLFSGFTVMCSAVYPATTCDVNGLDTGQTVGIMVNADNAAGTTPSAMIYATAR